MKSWQNVSVSLFLMSSRSRVAELKTIVADIVFSLMRLKFVLLLALNGIQGNYLFSRFLKRSFDLKDFVWQTVNMILRCVDWISKMHTCAGCVKKRV